MTFGPDGKVYIGTAFGTPAGNGIWRANADGSGLQQIIPASMIPGTNWNIRDLSIADPGSCQSGRTPGLDAVFPDGTNQDLLEIADVAINVAAVAYLLVSKRLFGLRGGRAAYDEERRGEQLLDLERAAAQPA